MRLRILLVLCLAFPLLTGWGHWGPQVKVGFALDKTEGREPLLSSMKEEMAENRADLLLKDAKGDPATQENQVKELIAKGIQALVVLPVDPKKAAPLVEAAHQAGIKVISLERLIPDSGLDYQIAFDDAKAGGLEAKALVKKVPQGRYVLLEGNPDREGSKNLGHGQMKELQPLIGKGNIQIAASRTTKNPETPEKWAEAMEAVLKAERKKIDAVLAWDSAAAEGALQALDKAGLSGKVPVAGIGEDLQTCRRILSGDQALTLYHPPRKLAAETAYLAAKLARKATQFDCQFTEIENGGSKTLAVLLTPLVVDARNLDSTIIADGVQKREDVYGK